MQRVTALLAVFVSCSSFKLSMTGESNHVPVKARDSFASGVNIASRVMPAFLGGFLLSSVVKTEPATAKVYFDTDTYGDKELKIATVNKMKQKLRNAILADVTLAPDLLRLAINDALTFDAATRDGGPDGSIQFEMTRDQNKGLEKAAAVVQGIKKELMRTNTVSYSDLVAFGGAEALESAGCGRVIVQVGRFDAKKETDKTTGLLVNWGELTPETTSAAFTYSGLGPREIALLLGALGEVTRVVEETQLAVAKEKAAKKDDDDDDFELDDAEPFVPTTFGARDATFGARMGKADFGVKYLSQLLKSKGPDALGNCLVKDDKTKAFVQKYATSETAFLKDVPEAYLRMTLLGETGTNRNS